MRVDQFRDKLTVDRANGSFTYGVSKVSSPCDLAPVQVADTFQAGAIHLSSMLAGRLHP